MLRSASLRPLQTTTWRDSVSPAMRSCKRSTEESTKRAVPWLPISSPSTCQGSMAKRSSISMASILTVPKRGKRNSRNGSNHSSSKGYPARLRSVTTSRISSRTKCGNRKRSCNSVPQRTRSCSYGFSQNQAISVRNNRFCTRLMRAWGGISKARSSTRPSLPVGLSGE